MKALKPLNGNQTIAEAMRQIDPDVVAAYPITPSTDIVESIATVRGRRQGITGSSSPSRASTAR